MTTPIKKASYIRNMGTCGAALIIAGIGPWGWNCRPAGSFGGGYECHWQI